MLQRGTMNGRSSAPQPLAATLRVTQAKTNHRLAERLQIQ